MKVLHTSDWHVGQVFYNYDRSAEHEHFFKELAEVVRNEQVDVMVVSGDVFHNASPSASAYKLLNDMLLKVCSEAPEMEVIVTAGNHDSASRIDSSAQLWLTNHVHMVGSLRLENPEAHIIDINGKGWVLAMPYFSQYFYSPKKVYGAVIDRAESLNVRGLPVVMMAHAAVDGSDTSDHDDIGGMDTIGLDQLLTKTDVVDYVALGHIHCPQTLKCSEGKARYCGVPLPTSFNEHHPYGVDIVTVEHGATPEVRTIKFEPLMKMITVPKDPKPFAEAMKAIRELPQGAKAYVRVNLLKEGTLPSNAAEKACAEVTERGYRYCEIHLTRPEQENTVVQRRNLTVSELSAKSPMELAEEYYKTKEGVAMPENLKNKIQTAIEQVNNEERK
ncbi:MAG: exonuclease SbcCD subunit D [Bacteroidales bacterium]|nr:exonuclease SbcCD subunit D [Bacteroidales bacterium]